MEQTSQEVLTEIVNDIVETGFEILNMEDENNQLIYGNKEEEKSLFDLALENTNLEKEIQELKQEKETYQADVLTIEEDTEIEM